MEEESVKEKDFLFLFPSLSVTYIDTLKGENVKVE